MPSRLSIEARIMKCPADYAGRSALVDAIDACLEEHRRAGWEACREAAMNLCRAEADRQEAEHDRSVDRGDIEGVETYSWGVDIASALVEDIKRMPYPEKKP